ncbi:response regulator [Cobetia sp. L2A1]|uniref:response regulator n=1 Tax=Cobetia sp. L2A1 TaxID=2686360 RepID=UPI00131AF2FF|nr:response regulator [Cobetia sp. L2A1]
MTAIRVVLVDDHPLFRRGLGELLSEGGHFEIVAEFDSGLALLEVVTTLAPALIIVDWQMPEIDGITLMRRLKALDDNLKVVLLTASDDSDNLLNAIQQGADGYLLKDTNPDLILERLQAVIEGKLGLDEESILMLARRLQRDHRASIEASSTAEIRTSTTDTRPDTPDDHGDAIAPSYRLAPPDGWEGLTERERDTLTWIGRGLSNKLIARELGISDSTVKVYVKNLLRKLNLHSRLELAAWVYAHPLAPDSAHKTHGIGGSRDMASGLSKTPYQEDSA